MGEQLQFTLSEQLNLMDVSFDFSEELHSGLMLSFCDHKAHLSEALLKIVRG